jgi:hypothetical protein
MTNKEEFEDTKGNQNLYIEEEQTTQWPKDRRTDNTMAKRQKNKQHNGQKTEEQKYKQRSTKYTQKSKDRVTRTPLKTGGEQTYTHNNNLL